MTITPWDINAVVLHHLGRFFQAARAAISNRPDPAREDRALLGALVTLSGNMLWARSSFEAEDQDQERAMAYGGALIGSLAERALPAGEDRPRQRAAAALAALERQIHAVYDDLLCGLAGRLEAEGLSRGTPGQINEALWSFLFPCLPYGASQEELASTCQGLIFA